MILVDIIIVIVFIVSGFALAEAIMNSEEDD